MFANKKVSVSVFALLAIFGITLACVLPGASTQPQPPAFDPTKAALELQATAMSLQLTQAALNNAQPQFQPPQPAVVQPTLPPSLPTIAPTATPDLQAKMKSAKILVYENTDERNIGMWIGEALDEMGLQYTQTGSYSGRFMEYLNSGVIYDLIIVGAEDKDRIVGEFWDVIHDRLVRDKAALIIEVWDLDRQANGPISKILGGCGVRYQKDYQVADSIYWWEPTHPVFNEPNTVLPLLHYSRFWARQTGDQIRLGGSGDAVLLAGLAANKSNQEAVLATCYGGRVIIQTFSDHDYHREDVVPLWQNYIYNTLKNRFAAMP